MYACSATCCMKGSWLILAGYDICRQDPEGTSLKPRDDVAAAVCVLVGAYSIHCGY